MSKEASRAPEDTYLPTSLIVPKTSTATLATQPTPLLLMNVSSVYCFMFSDTKQRWGGGGGDNPNIKILYNHIMDMPEKSSASLA